jgi:malic enzyme
VALAGILTALRAQGKPAKEITKQRIVCLGGGSAGLGVINSLIDGMVEEGLSREVRSSRSSSHPPSGAHHGSTRATYQEANKNVWVVDAEGLIAQGRKTISDAQQPFVRSDLPNGLKLKEIVDKVASADHLSAAVRTAYIA